MVHFNQINLDYFELSMYQFMALANPKLVQIISCDFSIVPGERARYTDTPFVTADKKQSDVINSEVGAESPLHKLRNGTRVLIPADGKVALAEKKSLGSSRDFNLEAITIRFH